MQITYVREWNWNALLAFALTAVSPLQLLLLLTEHFCVMFFSEAWWTLACGVEGGRGRQVDGMVTQLCSRSSATENLRAREARAKSLVHI